MIISNLNMNATGGLNKVRKPVIIAKILFLCLSLVGGLLIASSTLAQSSASEWYEVSDRGTIPLDKGTGYELNPREIVEGLISSSRDISACIKDASGKVVKDFGRIRQTNFKYEVKTRGIHYLVIYKCHSIGRCHYSLKYRILPPPNRSPIASIDSISPSKLDKGESVSFSGHGDDPDGSILAYSWRSNIDGQLSTSSSFTTSGLSVGNHTIYLKVMDNDSLWSEEVSSTLLVERPSPYVELYGHRTDVRVEDEVILNLSVVNPITSPGALTVQLTLSVPSGWSITSSGFGHGAGGLWTYTDEIPQGPNPRTIYVHILANQPYDGEVTGYMDYYFAKEEQNKYHKEVTLPVTATKPPPAPKEVAPAPEKGGGFSCSGPAQGAPSPTSAELLLGWTPIALCWVSLGGFCGVLRWRRRK